MTWLNWSLKLYSGLWTIPHLILSHNTQDFSLMLISFVWLYMIKCYVYTQSLVDQTQKDFWVFYMFLKVILYFRAFKFLLKMHFCIVLQKFVQRHFREKLETKSFPQKEFKGILKILFSYKEYRNYLATISRPSTSLKMIFRKNWKNISFIQRLSRLSRNCFATKIFSRKLLCFSGVFRD